MLLGISPAVVFFCTKSNPLVGWLAGWLAGWLVGRLAGRIPGSTSPGPPIGNDGWQLGVAWGWFKFGGLLAALDLHEGGSWGGLGLI